MKKLRNLIPKRAALAAQKHLTPDRGGRQRVQEVAYVYERLRQKLITYATGHQQPSRKRRG